MERACYQQPDDKEGMGIQGKERQNRDLITIWLSSYFS